MKFSTKVKAIRNGMDFTHGVRRALVGALMLIYLISLGFDVVAVATLFAVGTVVMLVFEFPTGAIADYDSRKKSLMISFILMSVSFFGIFLFKNFWVIAGFWMLQEIAWAFCSGAGTAWAIDALNYAKKKSKLVSLISQGWMFEKVGHVIGGLVGMAIILISFRFIWLVVSLAYLALFFILWKYMEERNFKPEKIPHSYLKKSLIKFSESFSYLVHKDNRDIRILMLGEFILAIAYAGLFVGVPLLFTDILGLDPGYLAGIYAVVSALAIGGPLIANKISKNDNFGKSMFGTVIIIGIALIALAVSKSLILAFLTFAVVQVITVTYDVVRESACHHEFDSNIRASLGSLGSVSWGISSSIGFFLAGFGVKFLGVVNTLLISGVIMFLTAFVYLWMKE
jgi:MFS family permease